MDDVIGLILDDINHHSVHKNHTNDTYTCTCSIQIGSIMVAEICKVL